MTALLATIGVLLQTYIVTIAVRFSDGRVRHYSVFFMVWNIWNIAFSAMKILMLG